MTSSCSLLWINLYLQLFHINTGTKAMQKAVSVLLSFSESMECILFFLELRRHCVIQAAWQRIRTDGCQAFKLNLVSSSKFKSPFFILSSGTEIASVVSHYIFPQSWLASSTSYHLSSRWEHDWEQKLARRWCSQNDGWVQLSTYKASAYTKNFCKIRVAFQRILTKVKLFIVFLFWFIIIGFFFLENVCNGVKVTLSSNKLLNKISPRIQDIIKIISNVQLTVRNS